MRRLASRITAVALSVTAVMSVSMGPAGAADNKWTSYKGGIAPGATIAQLSMDGNKLSRCTAGYMFSTGGHAPFYVSTAGHCREEGFNPRVFYSDANDPSKSIALGPYEHGQTKDASSEKEFPFTTDMALIRADNAQIASVRVAARYRVTQVVRAEQLREGMELCKFGFRTEETCGPITNVGPDRVTAKVYSLAGDSGAPAYIRMGNDEIAAVGLLSGSPDNDDSTSFFYYLVPVMKDLNLRLMGGATNS